MPHKIDVIIPCYNYAHFLDECLTAVTGQTRGDFSVLLMDNASTDNTPQVAEAWMQRDPRIRYQRNESNIGAVGNMQRGYELTAAEYVVILPADDLWEPEFLARTCAALDAHPECAYAYTGWGTCRRPTDPLGKMTRIPHAQSGPVEEMPFLTVQNYIPLSFGVFRRSSCVKAGGVYPRFLPMLGDLYLWMRLAAEGRGYFVNEHLGRLRIHGENTSHDLHATGRSAYDHIHLLDLVFESERWPKPIRLLAKARQMQLLTGEKISDTVRALGNDKTLPIIQSYINPERFDLYLIAAMAIRGYPDAAAMSDTASDADDLLAEVIGNAPADSAFNLLGDKAGQASANNQRQLNSSHEKWLAKRSFIAGDINVITADIDSWPSKPVFQILVRLDADTRAKLADTLESLNHQFYGNWRIDIVSTIAPPAGIEALANLGWHVVEDAGQNKASLDMLVAANRCDWIVELPPGAVLDPLCLWRIASEGMRDAGVAAFYVDDDVIGSDGSRNSPRFKTQLDIEWSRSADIVGPLFVRRTGLRSAGGLGSSNESPWYDLLLRLIETGSSKAIRAIPDVLLSYIGAFPSSQVACMTALAEHLTRQNEDCDVTPTSPRTWRLIHHRRQTPAVSILIPSSNTLEFLEPCLNSILEKTRDADFEVIVVSAPAQADRETREFLGELTQRSPQHVRILPPDSTTSGRSAAFNQAARAARGEFLLLLSEDTRVLQEDWLNALLDQGLRPGVGAVMPRLVQPHSGMIENAGYALGMRGLAGAPHRGSEKFSQSGYMDMLQVCREIAAAPTSCLLVSRMDYQAVGGLDAAALPGCFADIDFSLKLRALGRKLVHTPFATVVHYGDISEIGVPPDASRLAEKMLAEQAARQIIRARWPGELAGDGLWNPNLGLSGEAVEVESRFLPTWRYLPGVKPRIFARPLPNGQGLYRISQPLRAARNAGLAQDCEAVQGKYALHALEIARLGADSLIVQHFLSDPRLNELHDYRRFAPEAFIVYSCDDLITDMPLKSHFRNLVPADARRRFKAAVHDCDRLVVSTQFLADTFSHLIDDIRIVPNRLERDTWLTLKTRRRTGPRPRIGWAGGTGHQGDLELIRPIIEATRDEADWVFFGMCPPEIRPLLAEYHELVGFNAYPKKLASLNLDIAVAPLEDIPFNYGKSNLRLLEYGALGIPVVCSDILPYRNSPAKRVANEPAQWISALRERIHDLAAAEREGEQMKAWVVGNYILEDHLHEWLSAHLPGR